MSKSWKVEQTLDIVTITFNEPLTHGREQYVLLTADRHWDNPHSDWKLQKKHLDLARERNAPVIDIGDFFCAMQGKFDPRRSYDDIRPEHVGENYLGLLLDTAEDFFEPYADLFAVIGMGNHESAILKKNSLILSSVFFYQPSLVSPDSNLSSTISLPIGLPAPA